MSNRRPSPGVPLRKPEPAQAGAEFRPGSTSRKMEDHRMNFVIYTTCTCPDCHPLTRWLEHQPSHMKSAT